jgi:Arc/MetJ-type ribon-helix-helix transcriptional regulator
MDLVGENNGMPQSKFSLTEEQAEFLSHFATLGYPDKSSLVREAIDQFRDRLTQQRLHESAELYAQVYAEEEALQKWTHHAVEGWPE